MAQLNIEIPTELKERMDKRINEIDATHLRKGDGLKFNRSTWLTHVIQAWLDGADIVFDFTHRKHEEN